MSETHREIKQWASEIGFDKVGIAEAGMVPHAERFIAWLDSRNHSGMGWMLNNAYRRLDPRCVVPGAKSVICVALNYAPAEPLPEAEGKIARYAWGNDYHHTMGKMLKQLTRKMNEAWSESKSIWYVDTGPVLERAWAEQAGIGWIGKSGILLSQDFGTWLVLGEIITTLELTPDQPEQDHCGTCTACIDSCPTQAITEPYVVDSNKCISYWTIEHRGEFPQEIEKSLDGWVFGCDVCQTVCPFNKFERESEHEAFVPRKDAIHLALNPGQSAGSFAEATVKSPLRRAKHDGIRRNIAANQRYPVAAPDLLGKVTKNRVPH